MSVASFHWIPDHPALFRRVAAALPTGGRLEAEFGGEGNIGAVNRALDAAGARPDAADWNFVSAAETAAALDGAGFREVDVRVVPDPVALERGAQLEAFLATVIMGAILQGLPAEEGRALVRRVAAHLPDGVVDYVRMQASATKG